MGHRSVASLGVLALAACGGAGGPGAPSPSGALMIAMPSAPVSFTKSDTVQVEVDTGVMGTITMDGRSDATIGLSFSSDPEGFLATATYESLEATMANPMGGNSTITEADLEGQLAFAVSPRGHATVRDRFQVEGEAAQMVGNVTLAHEFFLRLPDGSVGMGDSWVDTLVVDEAMEGVTTTTTTVTTYMVEGDTMVAGMQMLKVNANSEIEAVAEGTMQGMSMSQALSGTSTGSLLWDLAGSLLYSSNSVTELSGGMTVDMPGAPDMTMSITSRQHTSRAGN